MPSKPSSLWRTLRAYQIYGANTDVGKTVISTILCKTLARSYPAQKLWYLKPISTGPLAEADDRHISRFSPKARTRCLFQFDEAVSPHIAARSKPVCSLFLPQPILITGQLLSDSEIQDAVLKHLTECSQSGSGVALVETAGGVHSPTPSGSSQADLYRPLRLPIWLVADHRLGGISASISAFESLHIRGYDIDAVFQFRDNHYQNHEYLQTYFEKKGISTISIPLPPKREANEDEDAEIMSEYYERMSVNEGVGEMIAQSADRHQTRIRDLEEMASKAHKQIWYPFTQHRDVSEKTILTIDSASGDFFQTRNSTVPQGETEGGLLSPTFDGSASWWTQGLGHGNPELSLAAAYAAGRYGHVMFAGAINEPALALAESLLANLDNPRLGKVFYSDNGSTGMEVATKMALTAAVGRYEWDVPKGEVGVLGLKGSYHGDTVGAMDCSEPSTYNERVHWYKGRGYWFDFPQVKMVKGKWVVEPPAGMEEAFGDGDEYSSLRDIFDIKTRYDSPAGQKYRKYIEETLHRLVRVEGKTFGGLIMEPVILGAGGMLLA
jgi:dethiobiotin synthetase/adenosylmethionine--8-amino-7-oxononanoate aminotransferase